MSHRSPSRLALLAAAVAALSGGPRAETIKVPGDFATIQDAVVAAETGDVVQVAKGVYAEQVLVFTPGITLVGKGAVIDAGFEGPCIELGAPDVTISGFTLVNGTFGVVDDASAEGGVAPDRTVISRCTIRSCRVGVSLVAAQPTIERTSVLGCEQGAIRLDATTGVAPAVLARNHVEGIQSDGVSVQASSVVVERNVVRACVGNGVSILLPASPPEGDVVPPSIISRNRIENCLNLALAVRDELGFDVTIERNKLTGNGRGLTATGTSFRIIGNDCSRNAEKGMLLGDESDHLILAEVRGNTCRGNGGDGIHLGGPLICRIDLGPSTYADNDCSDNGREGIIVRHAHADKLEGNLCRRNGGDGIDIEEPYAGLVLVGNVCAQNEHEGIDNGGVQTILADNRGKKNARGVGPDLAGTGDLGVGSTVDLGGNVFGTGGFDVPARLDLDEEDSF